MQATIERTQPAVDDLIRDGVDVLAVAWGMVPAITATLQLLHPEDGGLRAMSLCLPMLSDARRERSARLGSPFLHD